MYIHFYFKIKIILIFMNGYIFCLCHRYFFEICIYNKIVINFCFFFNSHEQIYIKKH